MSYKNNEKFDNMSFDERISYIKNNEMLALLSVITSDDFEELPEKSKERIKKKLLNLKICLGYIIDDKKIKNNVCYIVVNYNNSDIEAVFWNREKAEKYIKDVFGNNDYIYLEIAEVE